MRLAQCISLTSGAGILRGCELQVVLTGVVLQVLLDLARRPAIVLTSST